MCTSTIDLHLPSGLVIRDAVSQLRAKFGQWSWDRYDGIPVADPNVITDHDLHLAFSGARARTNIADIGVPSTKR